MDRSIIYPGQVPLVTDVLRPQVDAMIGLGMLARAVLGTNVVLDGLAVAPTSPASLSVSVGPGSLYGLGVVDASAFGSLAADSRPLVQQGLLVAGTTLGPFAAPATSGQSVNILIQAGLSSADTDATLLPYMNAAAPSMPWGGAANDGVSQPTRRTVGLAVSAKVGTPATTGSQATPGADSGCTPVAVLTLAYGQTTIAAASISAAVGTSVLRYKLPDLAPGFAHMAVLTASTTWTVPVGVARIRLRGVGGGGGSAAFIGGNADMPGCGGGAGYFEGIYTVVPGTAYAVTIGAGGAGGTSAASSGVTGGTTSFGALATAVGGAGGVNGANPAGGAGGIAFGGQINVQGGDGTDGLYINGYTSASNIQGGPGLGGNTPLGGGGRSGLSGGVGGHGYGSGAGAPYNSGATSVAGAAGAAGVVIIEY